MIKSIHYDVSHDGIVNISIFEINGNATHFTLESNELTIEDQTDMTQDEITEFINDNLVSLAKRLMG